MILGHYDFGWRGANVPALALLVCIAAAGLALKAMSRSATFGAAVPVDSARVAQACQKINPNTASLASLRRLSGIGPVRAQAIVDYAAAHPGKAFARAEDLDAVNGLGPAAVERLKPFLVFDGGGN